VLAKSSFRLEVRWFREIDDGPLLGRSARRGRGTGTSKCRPPCADDETDSILIHEHHKSSPGDLRI
jgi:hypothetical protein